MPDRENVVSGLQELSDYLFREYKICYKVDEADCYKRYLQASNALKLLKEQETQLICNLLGGEPYEIYCRECRTIVCTLCKGETMEDVKSIFKYCPSCGRVVKRDD